MRIRLGRVIVVAALLAPALPTAVPVRADQAGEVRTVQQVDLNRYVGTWYEIWRFPNRFQKQCASDVTARYARRDDGRLDVTNACRLSDGSFDVAGGVARVVDQKTSARLKVRFAPAALSFLPMVWGDYWVIGLAPDYSWAVVGSPDRKYLWILSRTPILSPGDAAAALFAARENGFDPGKLVATRQTGSGGIR